MPLCADNVYKENENEINSNWWKFERDGAPRYRWTEKYKLSHEHDNMKKKILMKRYSINKGYFIQNFIKYMGEQNG